MQVVQVKSYLKYLTDSLGVKSFDFVDIADVVQIDTKSDLCVSWELGFHHSEQNHLLFLLSGKNWESISPDLKELFLKIRAAMKLNANIQSPAVVAQWDLVTLSEFIGSFKTPIELILFEEDKNLLDSARRIIGDHTLVVVPSLALMSKKPAYKKIAWERIKTLAVKLNEYKK